MSPRTWEIIRIIVLHLIGAVVIFFAQPYVFLSLGSQAAADPTTWGYFTYASIVFGLSVFSVVIWYAIALNTRVTSPNRSELSSVKAAWLILLVILAIVSVALGIFLVSDKEPSRDMLRASTIGLFLLDIFITYWLPTSVSAPKESKYVPPLSRLLRPLFD